MTKYEMGEVKDLKEGGMVMMDDHPCKINSMSTSRPGKHGHAKSRVKAKSVIDGSRHHFVKPTDERVKIPRVLREEAQIIADMGDKVQLMDMESYENFQLEKPEDLKDDLEQGQTVIVKTVMNHKEITRIKSD